jgi:hypothetical protein
VLYPGTLGASTNLLPFELNGDALVSRVEVEEN